MGIVISVLGVVVVFILGKLLYQALSANSSMRRRIQEEKDFIAGVRRSTVDFFRTEGIDLQAERYEWPCSNGRLVLVPGHETAALVNAQGYERIPLGDITDSRIDTTSQYLAEAKAQGKLRSFLVGGVLAGEIRSVREIAEQDAAAKQAALARASLTIRTGSSTCPELIVPTDGEATAQAAQAFLHRLRVPE